MNPYIRWLIRSTDMPEVLRIENESFDDVWTEEDFLTALEQDNCIGMVAEVNESIEGFVIYELHKAKIRILNFAVHPDMRREGIGSALIEKMIGKLSQQRWKEITLELCESDLDAQLFFQAMGFRAVRIIKGYYAEVDEDAYVMRYRVGANRISGNLSELGM